MNPAFLPLIFSGLNNLQATPSFLLGTIREEGIDVLVFLSSELHRLLLLLSSWLWPDKFFIDRTRSVW